MLAFVNLIPCPARRLDHQQLLCLHVRMALRMVVVSSLYRSVTPVSDSTGAPLLPSSASDDARVRDSDTATSEYRSLQHHARRPCPLKKVCTTSDELSSKASKSICLGHPSKNHPTCSMMRSKRLELEELITEALSLHRPAKPSLVRGQGYRERRGSGPPLTSHAGETKVDDRGIQRVLVDTPKCMILLASDFAFVTHEWLRYNKEPCCQAFFTSIA
ncbi:hypothetical protein EDC04DRAFT_3095563 [Pisolithus marmoratus]|nr:hypothetical protein EDC04DRAFT_3095563 [Pisolithus marmoratus]